MLKFSYQLLWLVLLWSSPTVVTPLLSASVATTGAHTMLPPSSSASMLSPFTVLVAVESPSTSSRPRVSLYHLYTSSDADSLWSRRPWLTLCQPLTRILLGQLGCRMLLILPKSFSKGVWQFWRRMDSDTKIMCIRWRPWRRRSPNEGLLLVLFEEWIALRWPMPLLLLLRP